MEFELIDRIRARTAQARGDVRVGIGDDAAVLQVPAGQELVMALDTLVAGVHFPATASAADIGWKALAVNLSDLAAMGAIPAWALLGLTLPEPAPDFVDALAEGFAALARSHRVALVGGDTTRGPLSLSVAIHGLVPAGRALRRSGAQPGDAVLATGTLGDAAAGLALALGQRPCDPGDAGHAFLLQRLHRPSPRVAAGLALRDLASACIDISDGLLADLGHLARASGVGIALQAQALPLSPALRALAGEKAAHHALTGGDDYELCFTVPAPARDAALAALARLDCPATCIGRVVAGAGVQVEDMAIPAGAAGWDHFRNGASPAGTTAPPGKGNQR